MRQKAPKLNSKRELEDLSDSVLTQEAYSAATLTGDVIPILTSVSMGEHCSFQARCEAFALRFW